MTRISYRTFDIDPVAGLVFGLRGQPIGSADSSGYIQIDGRARGLGILSAHRLIWESVNGSIPDGKEINHINGVKVDNRIANLELATRSENILHAYRTGLKTNRGEKHPCHRLTEVKVREIRRRHANGEPVRLLAAEFSVSGVTIRHISNRKTWIHI